MKRDEGMPLDYAWEMAGALVELLAPACKQIEIAGSVRRQKAKPNDIEIVAVPKLTDRGRNRCDLACEDLLRTGQLEKRPDGRGQHCWGTGGADGGAPPRTCAAKVEQEPLDSRPGAFSAHRAQVNQLLSPALHKELGGLTSLQIAV